MTSNVECHFSGVVPSLSVHADVLPVRTECGIGALMPWAGRLWFITYVAHTATSGGGTGLYEIDEHLVLRRRPESVVGTFANRMIHSPTSSLIIGPHIIEPDGTVRTFHGIESHRLAATMEHLSHPERMVYLLTMEGLLLEADLASLRIKEVADLNAELHLPAGAQPHFKAGYTGQGHVFVTNNTYDADEAAEIRSAGRLAEWDGTTWRIVREDPFNEVTGRTNMGNVVFATGWDRRSALLMARIDGKWSTYRLPRASGCFDHFWQTEWPRIREVETERYLMDCHGMFYELSPVVYGNQLAAIRPISTHLRVIPDFCSWRGMLVLAGNQTTPIHDANLLAGEPQSNLWLGKPDDLWTWGKPAGQGSVWRDTPVTEGVPSDPYLMLGFDKKCLHLRHDSGKTVEFRIEVDALGDGTWCTYALVPVPADGYVAHTFPSGFSALWVRLSTDRACRATGCFIYA